MPYERDQVLCDCFPYCQHDGKPPAPQKCRARSDWYVTLCSKGECPGPFDKRCCRKPSQEPVDDDRLYDPIAFLRR